MLVTAELNEATEQGSAFGEFRTRGQGAARPECRAEWPVPRHSSYVLLKVGGEWILAMVLLLTAAPLLLVLAGLVKLTSSGPAFYAQTRLGRRGRHYRIFKLRTMVHNAETRTGPVWASKNDGRVTSLGKFLRRTHLDELPQLWNVVRGEMALIGPRPERPEIAARIEQHVPDFGRRLQMRPGVTGLAQMLLPADDPDDQSFRGVRKKLAHDLFYVRDVTFMLDVRILFCTACYFLGTAIDAIGHTLVSSYRVAIEQAAAKATSEEGDCEQAA